MYNISNDKIRKILLFIIAISIFIILSVLIVYGIYYLIPNVNNIITSIFLYKTLKKAIEIIVSISIIVIVYIITKKENKNNKNNNQNNNNNKSK